MSAFVVRALWETLFGSCLPRPKDGCSFVYLETPRNKATAESLRPVLSAYRPSCWCWGGHAQTLWASFGIDGCCMRVCCNYDRIEWITLDDGAVIRLDWKDASSSSVAPDDVPVLVICPGLGEHGGSSTVGRFVEQVYRKCGWGVVVVNPRGSVQTPAPKQVEICHPCHPHFGSNPVPLPLQAHGDPSDFRQASDHIRRAIGPSAIMFLVGLSAGANVALKYLGGEHRRSAPYRAAVSVSNAFDLSSLVKSWSDGGGTISDLVAGRLRRLWSANLADMDRAFAERHMVPLPMGRCMESVRSGRVAEFERDFFLPLFTQFASIEEMYASGSCADSLVTIAVPTLLLGSSDDPIVPKRLTMISTVAAVQNPLIMTAITPFGGHVGWLRGTGWPGETALVDIVAKFFSGHVKS